MKSARSLAKFDEINRRSAPAQDKTAAPEKQQKAAEAAAKAEKAARSTTDVYKRPERADAGGTAVYTVRLQAEYTQVYTEETT